jgi:uncharacterized OB-fold protein
MQVARHWRTRNQRYSLVGEVCETCGNKIFPPRDLCPECEALAKTPYTFSGLGEVFSYSTVYHAPEGYDDNIPYTVALVKLDEGPLVTAQLADVEPQDVSIGMLVEMVTRKIRQEGERGVIVYGYKFRPRFAMETA